MEFNAVDLLWVVMAAALVLLMQIGFLGIETGFSRAKNSINVAIKNTLDFCCATVLFWCLGFGLMFGQSWGGWVGTDRFFSGDLDHPGEAAFFLFQMVFCGTAATIVSGAIAERTRFVVYLGITVMVTGLIYPVFGHWAWGGVMGGGEGWLQRLGFIDFAGSTVVHSVGAWTALAALLVIGPRLGAFDARFPLRGFNLPMASIGTLILWFAWWGFNGGSTLRVGASLPGILLNTNLAGAAGGLAAYGYALWVHRTGSVPHILNGIIGGLVAVTAGCHLYEPGVALAVGAVGGCVAAFGMGLLARWRIDDVIGAVAAHGMAGMWGTLAVVAGDSAGFVNGGDRWAQFGVQAVGVIAAMLWTFGVAYGALRAVAHFIPLRVTAQEEELGLNVVEHGASTDLLELVQKMSAHQISGDFSQRVPVDPYAEVGPIAAAYNAVIEAVQREIAGRQAAAEDALSAKRRAEDANLAKDRFLANMSHEIRTPMNGVIGMIDLLRQSHPELSPEQLRYADVASGSAQDLLAILNDILDLSRIQTGEMALEAIPFDLADVVELTMDLHSGTAARKGLDLYCWIYEDVPAQLVGDPLRLRQVLSNLVSNAIKFTEKGQIVVRLSCARREAERIVLDVTVDDTGIGIPADVQRRLFRPFSQADSSTTRRFGGSGLGLAIARSLVERMDGRIGVASGEGRGSSFWFKVTLGLPEAAAQSRVVSLEEFSASAFVAVERSFLLRQLEHVLQPQMRAFQFGRSPLAARAWLRDREGSGVDPCVLIVDDSLFSGTEREEWREVLQAAPKNLFLLLLRSAAASEEDSLEDLTNLGTRVARMVKPVLPRRLISALRHLLEVTKTSEELRPRGAVGPTDTTPLELPSDLRILLVEDIRMNRIVVEALLKALGCGLSGCVENGEEALVALSKNPYDLVLMDCQMPIMDGYEATRRVRAGAAGEAASHVPIIAMTAHALAGDREKCLEAGMTAYLTKPISRASLANVIFEVVSASASEASEE